MVTKKAIALLALLHYDAVTTTQGAEMAQAQIHTALIGAMRDICKIGIGKTQQASTGNANYRYRGIDAAMNEMAPILVNHGITVTPRYSDLTVTERARDNGKFSRCVTIKGSFTFAAADGSSVTAEAYGESIDTGDKATIKAQSVAFRTVLFQQFVVPLMAMDSELWGEDGEQPEMPSDARAVAERGVAAYAEHFKGLTKEGRAALAPFHAELKAIAEAADKAAS